MSPGARGAVLALGLAGCGFHLVASGSDGDGGVDGPVNPDAVLPDAAFPDAMPDAMLTPNADDDNDGRPNAMDNCPAMANPDQRDHDADAKGDVCDRCPHLFGPDTDTDNDGIGDACDPRPSNAQDRRVLFTGFYDPAEITGWSGGGTWSVMGGALRTSTTTGQTGWGPPIVVNRAFVMTEYVVETVGPVASEPQLGIAGGATGNQRYSCTVMRTGTTSASVHAENFWPQQAPVEGDTNWSPNMLVVNSRVEMTMRLGTGGDECRGRQSGVERVGSAIRGGSLAGQVYLGTQAATARFDYLFIVDEMP